MKTDIHPTYHSGVHITCSCGTVIIAGSTESALKTELCSKCHPFYTGRKKLIDTAGRVDKFEARRKAAELHKQAVKEKERGDVVKKEEAVKVKKAPAKKSPPMKSATKKSSKK